MHVTELINDAEDHGATLELNTYFSDRSGAYVHVELKFPNLKSAVRWADENTIIDRVAIECYDDPGLIRFNRPVMIQYRELRY